MHYDYWLWESVLSRKFCDSILSETNWNNLETGEINYGKTDDGLVISKIDKSIRNTNLVWQNPLSPIGCIISTYIHSANQQAGWNMSLNQLEMVQIGKYDVGGKYDWHRDIEMHNFLQDENPRKLSCSILLNDTTEFKGGEFEFKNEKLKIDFKPGSIIVFPSYLEHRVTPVTEGTRYSAVSWMHGNKVKL